MKKTAFILCTSIIFIFVLGVGYTFALGPVTPPPSGNTISVTSSSLVPDTQRQGYVVGQYVGTGTLSVAKEGTISVKVKWGTSINSLTKEEDLYEQGSSSLIENYPIHADNSSVSTHFDLFDDSKSTTVYYQFVDGLNPSTLYSKVLSSSNVVSTPPPTSPPPTQPSTPVTPAGSTPVAPQGSTPVAPAGSTPVAPGTTSITKVENPLANSGVNSVDGFLEKILGIVIKLAIPIVTFFIIYAGFKFVMAQGNEKKLEEAKTTFYYALIGAAILLGAWGLASIIKETIISLTQ